MTSFKRHILFTSCWQEWFTFTLNKNTFFLLDNPHTTLDHEKLFLVVDHIRFKQNESRKKSNWKLLWFYNCKKTLKVNKPFKICFIISLSKYYTARKFKMKVYEEQRMNSRQVQFHDQKLRVHVKFIRLCLPLKQLNLRNSFLHQRLFFLKISYTKIMIFKIIKLEISSKGFFT